MEIIERGEFFRFDKSKGKRIKRECILHTQFYFSRHDFYLVEYRGYYFVCLISNGNLISLWYQKIFENGIKTLTGESISKFRKGWLKNDINEDKLSLFINEPLEYEKKYKPTNL